SQQEQSLRAGVAAALDELSRAEAARTDGEESLRGSERARAEAAEDVRRSQWLIEQRRAAPAQGPLAVRRAELEGALASERATAERLTREAEQARAKIERIGGQLAADEALEPRAKRLAAALSEASQAVRERFTSLER